MKKRIINYGSKSDVVIFIDEYGNKRWKWKTKKGAIYAKEEKKVRKK